MDLNTVNSESTQRPAPTDARARGVRRPPILGGFAVHRKLGYKGGMSSVRIVRLADRDEPRRSRFWPLKPVLSLSLERLGLLKVLDAVGLRDHGNAVVAY